MNDNPEPTTGDADLKLKQPEQQSSAIMILELAWVPILCVVCSICAILVLR